jgi:hypothetical protein
MPRNLRREVRVNWICTAALALIWIANLVFLPFEPGAATAFGLLVLLVALLSWRHARQVRRGQEPFAFTAEQVRKASVPVFGLVLAGLILVFVSGGGGNILVLLAPFLVLGVVAAVLSSWLRK